MSKTPSEKVTVWNFTKKPNISFAVFESVDSHKIFGCVKAIDKRLTSKEEWERLWGKAL